MSHRPLRWVAVSFGTLLVLLLVVPFVALFWSALGVDLVAATSNKMFLPALWLSLRTTTLSVLFTVVFGTPLSFWFSRSASGWVRAVELAVELPIVVPPAVVGVALLQTYGRQGLFGPTLQSLGLQIPFTEVAVVMAQIIVCSPFFIKSATQAFREIDDDLLLVARSLGASSPTVFFRVVVPLALPGLIAGASLAWARSLGEFGATLLFAGNLAGRTQTMPLAIFTALESDVRLAVVFSVGLVALGATVLLALRLSPLALRRLNLSRDLK